MRGLVRSALPWILAFFFAALSGFLLSRLVAGNREERRVDAAPVVAAIKKIAKLATVEAEISDVVRFEEIKSFLIFDFPKSATIRMRGRVIAGFDLTAPEFRLEPEAQSHRLRIVLPPPRILAIDPRLEWFDEKSSGLGIINPITPQDRTRWMLWARGQLARAAKQAGIEERAVDHARELLSGTAEAFGWKVEIRAAKPGDATPLPTP
jgi:Protein of unknown function (DUF4230)